MSEKTVQLISDTFDDLIQRSVEHLRQSYRLSKMGVVVENPSPGGQAAICQMELGGPWVIKEVSGTVSEYSTSNGFGSGQDDLEVRFVIKRFGDSPPTDTEYNNGIDADVSNYPKWVAENIPVEMCGTSSRCGTSDPLLLWVRASRTVMYNGSPKSIEEFSVVPFVQADIGLVCQ